MKLSQIINNPSESFIHMERYVNFSVCFEETFLGEINRRYSSFYGDGVIELALLDVPKRIIKVSTNSNTDQALRDKFIQNQKIRFAVHPQVIDEKLCSAVNNLLKESVYLDNILAHPTASMRTLFVNDELHPYFLKTHFPRRISSNSRGICSDDIERGQWLTEEFNRLSMERVLPKEIGYFPDSIGFLYESNGAAGVIVRDFTAYPKTPIQRIYVPMTSLFAKDKHSPKDKLLVEQLAEFKKKKLIDYLIEDIVTPHIKNWSWMVFEAGIIFSSHGQNTVLEFDQEWNVKRIDYRDFQGKIVISKIRKEKGYLLPDKLFDREINMDIKKEISLSYDFVIGFLLYDRMIKELSNQGFQTSEIKPRIKEIFYQQIRTPDDFFEEGRHYYFGFQNAKRIVVTEEKPGYR
ncbi:hypothetical protein HZC30_07340 [Candidatus Woesearchaeota archaeon]|nr:hypothetical protein [Candidatus Woesearchaeota archaeon]